jgi:hypothetical protein
MKETKAKPINQARRDVTRFAIKLQFKPNNYTIRTNELHNGHQKPNQIETKQLHNRNQISTNFPNQLHNERFYRLRSVKYAS